MYNTLLRMWKKGKIDATGIDNAVEKGWITAAQGEYIKSQPHA